MGVSNNEAPNIWASVLTGPLHMVILDPVRGPTPGSRAAKETNESWLDAPNE